MKKIFFLFVFGVLLAAGCKTTYVMTDETKRLAQSMTPEQAAEKLSALIEKDKSGARTGLDEIVPGGSTTVKKDSIMYSTIIAPNQSSGGFADGYDSSPTFTGSRYLVITVKFETVKTIKMNELKDGGIRVTLKNDSDFFLNSPMYQFETTGTNREIVIALCTVLMPKAKIDYSGGSGK